MNMKKTLKYSLIGLTALTLGTFVSKDGYCISEEIGGIAISKEVAERGFSLIQEEYEVIGIGSSAYARPIAPDIQFRIERYQEGRLPQIARALSCTLDREITIEELRESNPNAKDDNTTTLFYRIINDPTFMDPEY